MMNIDPILILYLTSYNNDMYIYICTISLLHGTSLQPAKCLQVIRKGDRIWRVNGKTGSADVARSAMILSTSFQLHQSRSNIISFSAQIAQELLEMLATDKKLHLTLRRCKEHVLNFELIELHKKRPHVDLHFHRASQEKEIYIEKKGKTRGP